jgi:hypothetical protein
MISLYKPSREDNTRVRRLELSSLDIHKAMGKKTRERKPGKENQGKKTRERKRGKENMGKKTWERKHGKENTGKEQR